MTGPANTDPNLYWDGTRWLRYNGTQWTDAATGQPIPQARPAAAGSTAAPSTQTSSLRQAKPGTLEANVITWERHVDALSQLAQRARTWPGNDLPTDSGFALGPNEHAYMVVPVVSLVERSTAPGKIIQKAGRVPAYSGPRIVGQPIAGMYDTELGAIKPIDNGALLVTNSRFAFRGHQESREWPFDKLVAFSNFANQPWTELQVSGDELATRIVYSNEESEELRFCIDLALADFAGKRDEFAAAIDRAHAQALVTKPGTTRS